jgi:anthranilate phosphoribosyltransferase
MDVVALAGALIAAQAGKAQLSAASSMLRMNADNQAAVARLVDAAQQNGARLANLASGVGVLSISVLDFGRGYDRRSSAAVISRTPSSLAHSAGPAMVPISHPAGLIRRVVGMPKARPMSLRLFKAFPSWSA